MSLKLDPLIPRVNPLLTVSAVTSAIFALLFAIYTPHSVLSVTWF